MLDKIGHIKNPLTIIAIFAAIAEISGTGILPFIDVKNQNIYVWFLIVFPHLLIVLFFLTLNFNHKVLYAPSDYKDEENFVRSLNRSATPDEKIKKLTEEAEVADTEENVVAPSLSAQNDLMIEGPYNDNSFSSPEISEVLAEDISKAAWIVDRELLEEAAFSSVLNEFDGEYVRSPVIGTGKEKYLFDAAIKRKPGDMVLVEFRRMRVYPSVYFSKTLQRIKTALKHEEFTKNDVKLTLVVAIITDLPLTSYSLIEHEALSALLGVAPNVVIKFYNESSLKLKAQEISSR